MDGLGGWVPTCVGSSLRAHRRRARAQRLSPGLWCARRDRSRMWQMGMTHFGVYVCVCVCVCFLLLCGCDGSVSWDELYSKKIKKLLPLKKKIKTHGKAVSVSIRRDVDQQMA
jgi:hypothetical protein